MKTFREHLAEKTELASGSRVIIDQSRFRSGRDPGRKLERLTGTIRKMGEDGGATVSFDRHVLIKGKKVKEMKMNMRYVSELIEAAGAKGKAQELIMAFLNAPGRDPAASFSLTSIASDKELRKDFGIVHFGKIQSGAAALAKKKLVQYDGISNISLKSPQADAVPAANAMLNRMSIRF